MTILLAMKKTTTIILGTFMSSAFAQRPKILCLHGGGGNAQSMSTAIQDLQNAMSDYEFVFAEAPYGSGGGRLWISDPPGGKGEPTSDPAFADNSIQALDTIVEADGPFDGILGYSQGAAFVPVYLSRVPKGTFEFAITFCGYLTTTHQGLLNGVNQMSPFGDIPHLVWLGRQDYVIANSMTIEMAAIFTNPLVVISESAGHSPPGTNDPTFEQVTSWIRQPTSGNGTLPIISASNKSRTSTTSTVFFALLFLVHQFTNV
jgi:predicted esterase